MTIAYRRHGHFNYGARYENVMQVVQRKVDDLVADLDSLRRRAPPANLAPW